MKKRIFVCLTVLTVFILIDQITRFNQQGLSPFQSMNTTEYLNRQHDGRQHLYNPKNNKNMEDIIDTAKKRSDGLLESIQLKLNTSSEFYKRIIIVSTWRSGSTFMADLIHSLPPTWYHYEPLNVLGIKQVRFKEEPALAWINSLVHCNYTNMDKYIKYLRRVPDLYNYNKEWRTICKSKFNYGCLRPNVLQQMCSLYPIQVLKTVRVRLRLLQSLLEDPTISMIYLVRDPRGTIQSRKHREWCPSSPDCFKSELLCSDLVDDYRAAVKLKEKYPKQFLVIRYEAFSSDVQKSSKALFKELSLPWHTSVQSFLKGHTTKNLGGPWSTFRDSKVAPFHWIHELSKKEVNKIQLRCARPLKMWGYVAMDTSSSEKNNTSNDIFNPVLNDWTL